MSFREIATFTSLLATQFRDAGLSPPRIVVSPDDAMKLRAMIEPNLLHHYGAHEEAPTDGSFATISGVRFYRAKERT